MPTNITAPNANPIAVAILNWFIFGFVGYLIIGQKQKAIAALLYTIVLGVIGIGFIFPIIAAVDGYHVAVKLQAGETIASDYCALEWLHRLPLWKEF